MPLHRDWISAEMTLNKSSPGQLFKWLSVTSNFLCTIHPAHQIGGLQCFQTLDGSINVLPVPHLFSFLGFGGGFKSFAKKVEYVGVAYAAVSDAVGYDTIGDAYTSKRVQIGVYGK